METLPKGDNSFFDKAIVVCFVVHVRLIQFCVLNRLIVAKFCHSLYHFFFVFLAVEFPLPKSGATGAERGFNLTLQHLPTPVYCHH